MRVALIADIHGNLVALEAVLADLAGEAVDRVVCLGDVAATGPQPREVVERLRGLGYPTVMGNADAELLAPPPESADGDDDAGKFAAISRWGAGQLAADDLAYLETFQPTLTVDLGAGAVLVCCHGSPRSFDEQITATTPDNELDAMLAGVGATVVAAGHTHVQLVRRHREVVLVNPGTVGLAFAPLPPAAPVRNVPWAEYAIVAAGAGGRLAIDLRRVPFDAGRLGAAVRASDMPHAEWWIVDWDVPEEPAVPAPPRRLKVDLAEVAFAMSERLDELRHCLDRETGEVVMVSGEALREVEQLSIDLDTADDEVLAAAISELEHSDFETEELLAALAVESGFGDRFIDIPATESYVAYGDMEEFIEAVADEPLQQRLWRAIEGRGAFRRFRDLLDDHAAEREEWHRFKDARERDGAIAWLRDEGIEPIVEGGR